MATSWQIADDGTFRIVERPGLVSKLFGGLLLLFSGYPLYWLGRAVVEYFLFGTWRDILSALPGMVVTLLMAALFGVPGLLMAFLRTKTACNKESGLIRHIKSAGVFRQVREKERLTRDCVHR